jgi:importin-7
LESEAAAVLMKTMLKAYWSSFQYDLGGYLATEAGILTWVNFVNECLRKPFPAGEPVDPDDKAEWVWWKLRKWGICILHRWVGRYSNVKYVPEEQAEAVAFFQDNVLAKVLPTVTSLLAGPKAGKALTPRVSLHAMNFLSGTVEYGKCFKLIAPHLQFFIEDVIIRSLMFTDEELEEWEVDPSDFARQHYSTMEHWLDPRTGARSLLLSFADKRGRTSMPVILALLGAFLASYSASEPANRDLRTKEAVMHVLGALSEKLVGEKRYKKSVEGIVLEHVLP